MRDSTMGKHAFHPAKRLSESIQLVWRRHKTVHAHYLNATLGVELLHTSDAASENVLDAHCCQGEVICLCVVSDALKQAMEE
jgi:hypothetical protein